MFGSYRLMNSLLGPLSALGGDIFILPVRIHFVVNART